MSPYVTIAAGAQVASGVAGFKGNRAAAKQARQVAAYNEQVTQNEKILLAREKANQEKLVRERGRRVYGQAVASVAASGVEISGSSYRALADITYGVEKDAAFVQYASNLEQLKADYSIQQNRLESQAKQTAYKTAAMGSLLGGVAGASNTYASFT